MTNIVIPRTTGKTIHMAGKVRGDGAMSAACYRTPRPIDLAVSAWTLRADAVTCPKCRRVLDGKRA